MLASLAIFERSRPAAGEVSLARLYALRACYLLLVLGLGLSIWPTVLAHPAPATLSQGVVRSMLAALSAVAVLGLRYPLQLLPLLFFELAWKSIWLVAVALPLQLAGRMDAATQETIWECLLAVVFVAAIPWPYVVRRYLTGAAERWR